MLNEFSFFIGRKNNLLTKFYLSFLFKIAWALNKGIKPDYKQYWDIELGVTYIPWGKVKPEDLESFCEGGMLDNETLSPGKRCFLNILKLRFVTLNEGDNILFKTKATLTNLYNSCQQKYAIHNTFSSSEYEVQE